MGVAIHFTGAHADLDLIADAFSLVRMDLTWDQVETVPGTYEFGPWDALVDAARARGVGVILILGYGNPLHTAGMSVRTPEERRAFTAYAAAAAGHFAGRVHGWEIWNEPNLERFWSPTGDRVRLYTAMAAEAAAAVRAADPEARVIAPNLATTDTDWLVDAMRAGLLEHLDLLSVHPYRGEGPETVIPDYDRIEHLSGLHGRAVPVAAGEWGYSRHGWGGEVRSEEEQASLLARRFLVDAMMGAPYSVWYEWRDSGKDPEVTEENFGTVDNAMVPRPPYFAARALKTLLGGFVPDDLMAGSEGDWVLVLSDGERRRVAAWTVGAERLWEPPFRVAAAWDGYGAWIGPEGPFTLGALPTYFEIAPGETG